MLLGFLFFVSKIISSCWLFNTAYSRVETRTPENAARPTVTTALKRTSLAAKRMKKGNESRFTEVDSALRFAENLVHLFTGKHRHYQKGSVTPPPLPILFCTQPSQCIHGTK